jgi:hypothetical protein
MSVVDPYLELRPTAPCDGQLAERLGVPVTYLRTMREKRVDLYDANVNGWLRGTADIDPGSEVIVAGKRQVGPDPRSFLVRAFANPDGGPGIGRAVLSDTYGIIDNIDVLFSVMEGIRESGVEAKVVSVEPQRDADDRAVRGPGRVGGRPATVGGLPLTDQARSVAAVRRASRHHQP